MSERVLIQTVRRSADARGFVFEPLEVAELPHQRNCHVVVTEPGAVRGNHHHPRGTEVLVVAGPAHVRCREEGAMVDTDVPAGTVMRFTIPPGVAHAVRNTGGAPLLLVGFNTVEMTAEAPNTVRDVILEP